MFDNSLIWLEGAITADGSKVLEIARPGWKPNRTGRTKNIASGAKFFYGDLQANLGGAGIGSVPNRMVGFVTQAFNNLTSLTFALAVSDQAAFGGSNTRTLLRSNAIALAGLTVGRQLFNWTLPSDDVMRLARYIRISWDVAGSAPTTGRVYIGGAIGGVGVQDFGELR